MSLHVRTPPAETSFEKRVTRSSVLTRSPSFVFLARTAAAIFCKLSGSCVIKLELLMNDADKFKLFGASCAKYKWQLLIGVIVLYYVISTF